MENFNKPPTLTEPETYVDEDRTVTFIMVKNKGKLNSTMKSLKKSEELKTLKSIHLLVNLFTHTY